MCVPCRVNFTNSSLRENILRNQIHSERDTRYFDVCVYFQSHTRLTQTEGSRGQVNDEHKTDEAESRAMQSHFMITYNLRCTLTSWEISSSIKIGRKKERKKNHDFFLLIFDEYFCPHWG